MAARPQSLTIPYQRISQFALEAFIKRGKNTWEPSLRLFSKVDRDIHVKGGDLPSVSPWLKKITFNTYKINRITSIYERIAWGKQALFHCSFPKWFAIDAVILGYSWRWNESDADTFMAERIIYIRIETQARHINRPAYSNLVRRDLFAIYIVSQPTPATSGHRSAAQWQQRMQLTVKRAEGGNPITWLEDSIYTYLQILF